MSSFVGRRRELAVARELLGATRLLTLTGTGGVGKTRLAQRLAEDTRRAFPDGTWIVELADLQQDRFVAQSLADTLGLRNDTGDPMVQLRDYLVDKQLLLLVDNCEHLLDQCAKVLVELLGAAPGVRVLATSRQVLGVPGEQVYPVPPLSLSPFQPRVNESSPPDADAMALFAERGRAANPEFAVTGENWATVAEICRRLDGVPLAIELAAVRLRALSEQQILERLDDALELLKLGPRTLPERQRRIEATIDWSYRLSTGAEQRLWRGLSVFAGGFTLDALEQICAAANIASTELLDALSGLVEKSIVSRRSRGGRHQMTEVLRQFGLKRLADSGEEQEFRTRHLRHYARLVERGTADYCSPRDREWTMLVRAEHANIRAALEFALSRPETVHSAMLIASQLAPYWTHTGYLREGYTWLRRALDANEEPSEERLQTLSAATNLALMLAEVGPAIELLDRCRALQQTADNGLRSQIGLHTALIEFLTRGPKVAVGLAETAVQLTNTETDLGVRAQALAALSIFAFCAEDPAARRYADSFLAMTENCEANLLRAIALSIVGLNLWRAGDAKRAEERISVAIGIYVDFDERAMLASAIESMGWLAADQREDMRAAQLFGVVDKMWRAAKLFIARSIAEFVGKDIRARVQRRLGEQAWAQALDQGARLSDLEVLNLIRRAPKPSDSHASPAVRPLRSDQSASRPALTRREVQIARLVADGSSNKEIATQLVISVRTAERHVENILVKLSVHSRTHVAAWVRKHLPPDVLGDAQTVVNSAARPKP
ncbi:LuxR C-terminal-related transcriptional regulator [Nocardia vaccinii]|uniref:LuxR C-terminal-related transcriptional regulator n=1 Tax=Nocardia vaccinii TaxID=1822 RepID=UPI001471FA34|nr:LuxR C-terminal-related transcriptional regulator [Nocardia vaccinii]